MKTLLSRSVLNAKKTKNRTTEEILDSIFGKEEVEKIPIIDGYPRRRGYNIDGSPFIKPDGIPDKQERDPHYSSIPNAMMYYGVKRPYNVPGSSQQFLVYYWVSAFAKKYANTSNSSDPVLNKLLEFYKKYAKATTPSSIKDLMHEIDDYCHDSINIRYTYKNGNHFYYNRNRLTKIVSGYPRYDDAYIKSDDGKTHHTKEFKGFFREYTVSDDTFSDPIELKEGKDLYYKDIKTGSFYKYSKKTGKLTNCKLVENFAYSTEYEIKHFERYTLYKDLLTGDMYRVNKHWNLERVYRDQDIQPSEE